MYLIFFVVYLQFAFRFIFVVLAFLITLRACIFYWVVKKFVVDYKAAKTFIEYSRLFGVAEQNGYQNHTKTPYFSPLLFYFPCIPYSF